MDLKSFVGTNVGPYEEEASAEKLRRFATAIGATPRSEAVPTYLTVCRKGEFDLLQKMGVPLTQILHGEQQYEFLAPIHPGDHLTYTTAVIHCIEKKMRQGAMSVLTLETEIRTGGGPAARARTVLLCQGGGQSGGTSA